MAVGILTDLTKCVGCQACARACNQINELPPQETASKLSATTWTFVEKLNGVNIRRQCMHCLDPTCASVCPVAALKKTDSGAVIYDEERCIGCRYCLMACPFEIPKYEWASTNPRVRKCILCYEKRVSEGGQPACTEACPTGATIFGDRDGLIQTARQRMTDNPGRYFDSIYGLLEVGGTSVLYLSDVPFDQLGFKHTKKGTAYPRLTWDVLSHIPNILSVGGVLMFGVWWVINRRMTLEREQPDKDGGTNG